MATFCDSVAQDFGEIVDAADTDAICHLQNLADTAASGAGDCCTPKK